MAEPELKKIPSEGKIKRIVKYALILTTGGWFLTTAAVLGGLMDAGQAELIGVTFDRWWVSVGVFLGVLAANDNGVKYSTALLNKPAK